MTESSATQRLALIVDGGYLFHALRDVLGRPRRPTNALTRIGPIPTSMRSDGYSCKDKLTATLNNICKRPDGSPRSIIIAHFKRRANFENSGFHLLDIVDHINAEAVGAAPLDRKTWPSTTLSPHPPPYRARPP